MDNTQFHPIDQETWPRREIFHYFANMVPTSYSMTVDVDITEMIHYIEKKQLKFFPVCVWAITKAINQQIEFKTNVKDGVLGYYDTLMPSYPTFHEDDETISVLCTEYSNDLTVFYKQYIEDKQKYGMNHGILARKGVMPPGNTYSISCMPWIDFKHFSLQTTLREYYLPSIELGKYTKTDDKVTMPLSITAHHATVDGWHIKKFLDELQVVMSQLEQFEF